MKTGNAAGKKANASTCAISNPSRQPKNSRPWKTCAPWLIILQKRNSRKRQRGKITICKIPSHQNPIGLTAEIAPWKTLQKTKPLTPPPEGARSHGRFAAQQHLVSDFSPLKHACHWPAVMVRSFQTRIFPPETFSLLNLHPCRTYTCRPLAQGSAFGKGTLK